MRLTLTIFFTFLILQTFAATGNVTYYISATGNNTTGTTQASAWNISKLNANWSLIKPGDQVLFNRGETFAGSLNIIAAGSAALPIYIGAYGTGAKPIISTLTTLSGWANSGSGVWTSTGNPALPADVNIVFVNNEPVSIGRYPNLSTANRGYLTLENAGSTTITDNELPAIPNWTGAEVVVRSRHWVMDTKKITNHVGTTLTVPQTQYIPSANFGYFFQNDIKTLDQLFEWCYNPVSKSVTKMDGTSTTVPANSVSMYFGTGGPGSNIIQASNSSNAISVNSSYVTIENLSIYGANTYGVSVATGKTNIRILNCDVKGIGNTGIYAHGSINFSSAIGCSVVNSYNNGIDFKGNNDTSLNNFVDNIYAVAGMGGSGDGAGIGIGHVGSYHYIVGNIVKRVGYIAINATPNGTSGNYNTVKNNLVDSFCYTKDDGGGIYTFEAPSGTAPVVRTGNVFSYNVVINGIGVKEGANTTISSAEGIYLDNQTNNVRVENNVIANVTHAGIFIHDAKNNTVRNNLLFNTSKGIRNQSDNLASKTSGMKIYNNTSFALASNQNPISFLTSFDDVASIGAIDSNYYCRPINEPSGTSTTSSNGIVKIEKQTKTSTGSTYSSTYYSLDKWQSLIPAFDANTKKTATTISSTSEVLFIYNPTNRDSTVSLNNKTYISEKGVAFTSGKTVLKPYSGQVLIVTPNVPVNTASLPTATITAPSNNTTYTQPVNLTISANASVTGATISSVDFYNGSVLLGSDNTSPYSYSWNNVPSGNLSITAKATDSKGNSGSSAAVNIVVNPANTAPTVSIDTPLDGSKFIAPATVRIAATATDNSGITKVEFYSNNVLIHTENNYPYAWDWANVAAGSYSITAKAYDNQGLTTTSLASSISVRNLVSPDVSITSPLPGQSYTAPATILLSANASDPDGTITKVEFYNNRVLVNTDVTSPYAYTLTNVPKGNDTIMVKAYDNDGNVTTSSVVSIVSAIAKKAPTVSITAPSNNATYTDPAKIDMVANASDADGTVKQVDFYANATLIGTAYTAPYTLSYSSVLAGSYALTAKATDNDGLVTTSAPINVTVTHINIAPTIDILSPKDGDSTISTTFNISVAANDPDGTITKVELLNGATIIATLTSSPYSKDITLPVGSYILTAKAYDNSGAVTSKTITYKVINAPVTVPIIFPGYKGVIK